MYASGEGSAPRPVILPSREHRRQIRRVPIHRVSQESGCPWIVSGFRALRVTRPRHYALFRLRRVPPRESPAHNGRARFAVRPPSGDLRPQGDPEPPRSTLQNPIHAQQRRRSVAAIPFVVPPARSAKGQEAVAGFEAVPIRHQSRPDISKRRGGAALCRVARHCACRLDGRRSAPAGG